MPNSFNSKHLGIYKDVGIFFIYLTVSVLLTRPLLFGLNSVLLGGPGDAAGNVWGLWSGFIIHSKTELLSAPFGYSLPQTFSQPVVNWLMISMAKLFGPLAGYNLLVMLSFPATAFVSFLCLRYLLRNNSAAFVGGLVFGFCPAAIAHGGGGHITFSFNVFIPLFILALLHNRLKRTTFTAALAGGVLSLITLTSLYTGYFCLFVFVFFIVFDWLASRRQLGGVGLNPGACPGRGVFLLNYLFCALFAAILVLPFEYKAIAEVFSQNSQKLVETGRIRTLGALVVYSVRMWEYFVPSIDHPVLGNFFDGFIRSHLHGSNTTEQTLYLGLVPLSLFGTGIVLFFKKCFTAEYRFYFSFFMAGAALMCLMSFPPYIPAGPYKLPLLGFFAHKLAPMFRVYSRFGLLVNFFVSCGAAVVLAYFSGVLSKGRYFFLMLASLLVLSFEYCSIPANYALSVKDPPGVYKWLAAQPEDCVVAEYPMMPNDEASFYTYLLWQTMHGKRIVNGAAPAQKEAWSLYSKVNYPTDLKTLELLRKSGVKYLIVHSVMYADGPIPAHIKKHFPAEISGISYNNGEPPPIWRFLKPYMSFGADVVYML